MPRKSTSQVRNSKNASSGGSSSSSGANAVPTAPLVACTSPNARTAPQFVVYFRRPLALKSVAQYGGPPNVSSAAAGAAKPKFMKKLVVSNIGTPALGCTDILDMEVELGLDARYRS